MLPSHLPPAFRWKLSRAESLYANRSVKIAEGQLLSQVFKLRYERYIADQGKAYPSIGHGQELIDPIDAASLNLSYVSPSSVVTCAVRMSWLEDVTGHDYLRELAHALDHLQSQSVLVCSRLVVGRKLQLPALIALFRYAYAIAVTSGASLTAISTRPELVSLFVRFGFRDVHQPFTHPIAGEQITMVLDLLDSAHLRAVSSPLLLVSDRLRLQESAACT